MKASKTLNSLLELVFRIAVENLEKRSLQEVPLYFFDGKFQDFFLERDYSNRAFVSVHMT